MIKSYTYSTDIFKMLHSTFGCQRGGDAKIAALFQNKEGLRDGNIFFETNHIQKTKRTNYRTQTQGIGRYWGFGVDLLFHLKVNEWVFH